MLPYSIDGFLSILNKIFVDIKQNYSIGRQNFKVKFSWLSTKSTLAYMVSTLGISYAPLIHRANKKLQALDTNHADLINHFYLWLGINTSYITENL